MIKVENISKKFLLPHEKRDTFREHFLGFLRHVDYETFFALREISFDVANGEWVGIIGRNGSGKSTLLKILAGIYAPDKGDIDVSGKVVPLLELGVGFHPDLTVEQNIFLNGTLLGIPQKKLKKQVDDILTFAEIKNFRDAKLKNLSSGMSVRLAFSIAMKTSGDIFLLDEVLAVGDAEFQKKCEKSFHDLRVQKKTVIFVSHNLAQVEQFCDRVIWIEKGKVVADGKPRDVIVQYEKQSI